MNRLIIIMAKVPFAGNVKTRLEPYLTPKKCAQLAAAFLSDTEYKAKNICENTILAYAPAAHRSILEKLLKHKHILIEQKGGDLGEKMADAFEFAFNDKMPAAVVIIGTDSPTFPAEYIEEAFNALETGAAEIVVGKTEDGGFYLIGLRQNLPSIFDGIAWSTSSVYEELFQNLEKLKIKKLKLVPTWFDVDEPEDVNRLYEELAQNEKARKTAPSTFQWLLENSEIFD